MRYTIITAAVIILLAGTTLLAGAATMRNLGVTNAEHPQGINLRDDSVRRGGFFMYYGRTHFGGGIAAGK